MPSPATAPSARWFAPLREPAVWLGAAKVALPIGLLQVVINQGDAWLTGHVTAGVLAKTLLTPAVTLVVAVLSAAAAWRTRHGSL
ncbi:MAG TPA: hypothetical protein VK477_05820 [Acidobacteriota bacterium]|nr:hypothetical protein [Acidobacteriota bacterium]